MKNVGSRSTRIVRVAAGVLVGHLALACSGGPNPAGPFDDVGASSNAASGTGPNQDAGGGQATPASNGAAPSASSAGASSASTPSASGSGAFGAGGSSGGFGGKGGFGGFGGGLFDAASGFGGFGSGLFDAGGGFGGFGGGLFDAGSGLGGFGGSSSGASASAGSSGGSGLGGDAGQPRSGTLEGGSLGSGPAGGSDPTMVPKVSGMCPTFQNGATVTVSAAAGSIEAQIWMGSPGTQGGPLILYWHGTGSSPEAEVPIAFDTDALANAGGMIAAFVSSSRTGSPTGNTGDGVWYESDATFADQVVACAIDQAHISPQRIHTAGYSAGGLQTVYMSFARSGYLASVISYSGGDDTIDETAFQDPSNVPAAIAAHGAMGSDALGIDFASASAEWESQIKSAGGFSIDCDDGGNHLAFFSTRAPALKPVALQFFLDHPFGAPNSYVTLPSGFPAYCHID